MGQWRKVQIKLDDQHITVNVWCDPKPQVEFDDPWKWGAFVAEAYFRSTDRRKFAADFIKAVADAAGEPTLTDALLAAGYTHRKGDGVQYQREVVDGDGVVVFTGNAAAVWLWLKANGES